MEQSLSTLTFKGSITEAIAEAKQQKKLFLVYISGEDPESDNLATSTWTDSTLAESILKFCILLHISEGSSDAVNFSAIYPQKSPPCVTAVGYNGLLLWQYDGFIAADILVSNIEKSWLSLHIQETTATYLATALASKEQPTSESSGDILAEHASSSGSKNLPEGEPSTNNEIVGEPASKVDVDEIGSCIEADNVCSSGTAKVSVNPGAEGLSITENRAVTPKDSVSNNHAENMMENSGKITKADVKAERNEDTKMKSCDTLEPSSNESNEVHFNIRLPDGSSLRVKFTVMDTLRMVKDYVDANRTGIIGPYDLAIPYPRKVFREEEFGKTLQELDLFRRQTLIVVQHGHSNTPAKEVSSLRGQPDHDGDGSSIGSNAGHWARLRGIVSFLNPLSYLWWGANSSDAVQESQNIRRPYSSNDSVQNNGRAAGARQSTRPPFGSNIHTLKHNDEDSDANTFWNGNSTQFGGDSDNNK